MNGLVVIDKPAGMTSHDVVNRWRKTAGTKRVGHLGTLDPMATGVLALLTGPATRLASFFEKDEKTYCAEIRFGFVSDTYDITGEVHPTNVDPPSPADIRKALSGFEGRFLQTPPPVSAKKVAGVPAYKLARKKLPVELAPVEVEIRQLRELALSFETLEIEVTCSAGTYIRSLAHDLGQTLGCGAVLASLRRTQAGSFGIDQAHTLEELAALAQTNRLSDAFIPAPGLLSHIPCERLPEGVEAQIRQGRQFRTSPFVVPPGAPLVRALSRSGDLVAIGKLVIPNHYQHRTVFQPE